MAFVAQADRLRGVRRPRRAVAGDRDRLLRAERREPWDSRSRLRRSYPARIDIQRARSNGRIDIRAAAPGDGFSNTGELNLNGHNFTKIGNGFFGIVNTSVNGTGDILVTGGTLSVEGTTRILDDGGSRIRVSDGAMFQI